MQRLPWIERKFHLDIPPRWIYNVIARLTGTEARLKQLTSGLSDEHAQFKNDDKWSIKEHIGHLSDLEDLHLLRLDDFVQHRPQLSVWDVTNAATENANHNENDVNTLITAFSIKRKQFIEQLKNLDDGTHLFQAMHPRLQMPMKPVDMATFIAEHDDHHIASILSIVQRPRQRRTTLWVA